MTQIYEIEQKIPIIRFASVKYYIDFSTANRIGRDKWDIRAKKAPQFILIYVLSQITNE